MEATVQPGLTRRQAFVAFAMVGAAAAVPALRRAALPPTFSRHDATGPATLDVLTLARFTPHVGSQFTVRASNAGPVTATLEEASATEPHPADRPGVRGEAFSLIFRGPRQPVVGDGKHTLAHPALGTFPLFLVAVGRGVDGQGYQAIVDRRVAPAR
jgi:hypothetical protein